MYNFHCDCIACKQQWPSRLQNLSIGIKLNPVDLELSKKFKNLMTKFNMDVKTNYDDKTIARLRDGIEKGLEYSSRPSVVTTDLIDGLQVIFHKIYGISLQVPETCHNV